MRPFLCFALLGASLSLTAACSSGSDNSPPNIDFIPDQKIAVGSPLSVALRATDPDGDPVTFSFKTELGNIKDRASIQPGAGGTAEFKYVPIGADVGIRSFTFIASDGHDDAKRNVSIEVTSAAAGAGTPVFVKPLGTGTTLDLTVKPCIDLDVEIQDADTANIEIAQEAPLIDGATLEQTGGLSATWHWCPTPEQASSELHSLVLSAYDGDNAKVLKDFLVVLQKGNKPNCPGEGPVITHQPADQNTTLDLAIEAHVTDDKGLKYPPLLMYSDKDPGPNPDLSAMTQVMMAKQTGDLTDGIWSADIPNPVADQPQGSSAKIYYLITAKDNDDETGDCDHSTSSPDTGAHQMNVTNSGGNGGLPECAPCSADVQCGGPNDTCIYLGGDTYCGIACVDDYDCPLSHECSLSPVLSVSGKSSKQCVPISGTCGGSTTQCVDDNYEQNDVLSDVKSKPGIPAGTINAKSCPGAVFDDEDWYPIDLSSEANVTATLSGGSSSNLDLMLTDSTGKVVSSSAKPTSQETVTTCLQAGRYYFHIWAWSKAENSYSLTWSKQSGCSAQCVDDVNEDDDNAGQARDADPTSSAFKSSAQQICSGDDDWYAVQMFSGETIHATLKFTQTKATQDLDLYLYDSASKQITKCTEQDPFSCDSSNGQSGTSNENLAWSITSSGIYYVVVHGWEGSSNKYDICIDYTSSSKTTNGCPPL